MATYAISGSGATYAGSTSSFDPLTPLTPIETFTFQNQSLITLSTFDTYNASGNGVNFLDIGLYIGHPLDSNRAAGELVWASNTGVHDVVIPSSQNQGAHIDEVFQTINEAGTLVTVLDQNVAPTTTDFDFYVERSGFLGSLHSITAGEVDLNFSADGTTVTGAATLYATGTIEPSTFAWSATFNGVLIG